MGYAKMATPSMPSKLVNGAKAAKSNGNARIYQDLVEWGDLGYYHPDAIRQRKALTAKAAVTTAGGAVVVAGAGVGIGFGIKQRSIRSKSWSEQVLRGSIFGLPSSSVFHSGIKLDPIPTPRRLPLPLRGRRDKSRGPVLM
ncbi:hypothetical protein FRB94_000029 [Tulasnella sp. JGI-2019a]|nr:hypothetical protein FRB94_000029 [Tulasnella sp. JGI-2019a]